MPSSSRYEFTAFVASLSMILKTGLKFRLFKYFMFVLNAATVVSFFNFFSGVARMALEDRSQSMKIVVLPSMERMMKLPV